MYFSRQVSPFLREVLPLYSLKLYNVHHRCQQQQLLLKCKNSCRSVAYDSRLLGCDTAVIDSGVTSVSKYHSSFIYKVRQSLNMKA